MRGQQVGQAAEQDPLLGQSAFSDGLYGQSIDMLDRSAELSPVLHQRGESTLLTAWSAASTHRP